MPGKINSGHLVDLATRSVGRPEVSEEETLSWTVITRSYVSATRGLSRWSGVSDRIVRNIVGPTGGLSASGFIWAKTRGTASAVAEEREQMAIRYSSNTRTDYRSTSSKNSSTPLKAPGALALKEEVEGMIKSNAVVSARISERAMNTLVEGMKVLATLTDTDTSTPSGKILAALDPSIDIWAEYEGEKPSYVAYPSIGRRAWSLAVACGMRDVVLSMEDIAALTGLSKRGAQALVKRMDSSYLPLVWKVRQGRSFVYEIKWYSCLVDGGDDFEHAVLRAEIRHRRALRDRAVQEFSARRGTGSGFLAFLHSTANAKRDQYLADHPLPDNASEGYRALVAEGDEMKLFEYFKAQEEGVSAPASPAALEAPVAAPQPEMVPMTPEEQAERLAAMRWRINTQDRMVAAKKAPEPVPASQPAREVDPEVLAAMRARVCASTYA